MRRLLRRVPSVAVLALSLAPLGAAPAAPSILATHATTACSPADSGNQAARVRPGGAERVDPNSISAKKLKKLGNPVRVVASTNEDTILRRHLR